MKCKQRWGLLLTALLIFSSSIWADDSNVAAWTEHTLLSTLTINYTESAEEVSNRRKNYTANAWNAIFSFLRPYIDQIRAEKLSLNPVLERPSTILESGKTTANSPFPNIPYWRINQAIYIPELKLHIAFSVLVVSENPAQHQYLIQSVDMVEGDNE